MDRDQHFAEFDTLLDLVRAGKGQVVFLEGAPVVGRTALLWSLGHRATAAGFEFLSATCSPQERTLSMGVVSQLLPVSEQLPGDDTAAQAAVTALLTRAAATPLLIGVDDLRHADAESVRCLLQLSRRVGGARIMVVLTDTQQPVDELVRLPYAHRMAVGPLSPGGIHRLVERGFDTTTANRLTPVIDALSGGNPLLVQSLLEDDLDRDGPTVQRYGRAFVSCLRRSGAAALQVAHGLAALPDDAAPEDAAEVADIDEEAARQALATINASGLLQAGRFRHPAARLAVLADLPAARRQELHRRSARLAQARGAAADQVGRLLVAAGGDPESSWAPEVLREAAEYALVDGDPEYAADCLRLAVLSPQADQPAVRVRLAEALWHCRPATTAPLWPELISDAEHGRLDARQVPVVIRGLLWHGRAGEADRLLELLRGRDERPDELADVEAWLGLAYPMLTRRLAGSNDRRHVTATLDTDPWLGAAANMSDLFARCRFPDAIAAARQVLRNVHISRASLWAAESTALALAVLIYTDDCDAAEEWCRQYLAASARHPTPTMRALVLSALAEALLRRGDLSGAVAQATAALAALPASAWGVAVAQPLATLVQAHTRAGDYEEAARHLAQALPDTALRTRYGLHYLHARGEYHLATGQHHAALADFLGCGELVRGWGLDNPGIVPWRTSAAAAWLSLGNADQARSMILDQLGRPGIEGTRARGASLRLLAAASTPGRQLQLLTEALEIFEARGDRLEQARVLYDLSRAHQQPDQRQRARLLLRRAMHVADLCGARPLYQEVRAGARDVGDVPDVPASSDRIESLTGSERRVAALAVMGYTNREIAAKLYISPSTVEQHLTRVYRKLDVKRRRDLPTGL
ncbi:LuxR C-terminal-related transcriptional regulator [Actinoplanes sp. NPDC023936]|uniref:helix-turn-helix transcriptional regulator n=1 Tax=Actinoplanes sp. NPDC023936 TaxID=3154910 RepID=UPI0034010D4B